MKKKELDINKTNEKIGKILIPNMINHLVQKGLIKNNELDDKKLVYEKVLQYMDETNPDINLITDYRKTILKTADNFIDNNLELSITLYATFVEHTLNGIIQIACNRKGLNTKTINEIIRSINIKSKATWFLNILDLPPINSKHVKTILKLSEIRNSFIHYKWLPDSDNDTKKTIATSEIKALVKYLKSYDSKLEFNGNKTKIKKLID